MRPILFSGPMVRAILEGRKTQTRRVVNPQPVVDISRRSEERRTWHVEVEWKGVCTRHHGFAGLGHGDKEMLASWAEKECPYGTIGDRLWVRETWGVSCAYSVDFTGRMIREREWGNWFDYRATMEPVIGGWAWKPSIHMPRQFSRITLEITDVRVERLQEISVGDAKAEGIEPFLNRDGTAWRAGFQLGWNEINAKRGYSWESNPWVWVISFKHVST